MNPRTATPADRGRIRLAAVGVDPESARDALGWIDPGCSREDWVRLAMAAKSAGVGFEAFHAWSSTASNYKSEVDVRDVWRSITADGGVTPASLFAAAREAGWRPLEGEINGHAKRASKRAKPSVKPALASDVFGAWEHAQPARADHPYIVRKLGLPAGLRTYHGSARIAGTVIDGCLLVPAYNADGTLATWQAIPDQGAKLSCPGRSFGDAWHTVGTFAGADRVYVVESIGAGWSAHQATRQPAAVAFGAGRQETVARAVRKAYPLIGIVLVADVGKEGRIERAAQSLGCCRWVAPLADLGDNADINDLHQRDGLQAVADLLEQAAEVVPVSEEPSAPSLRDFWALLPEHKYICTDTRDLWPAASVDGRLTDWPTNPATGKEMRPSAFLDAYRAVEQVTWCPGEPAVIENRVVQAGGWLERPGYRVFNLYRPPAPPIGTDVDVRAVAPWRDHLLRIYPGEAGHIERWLAFKAQHPGAKVNHALVLGGSQGIGKDTLLEPVKHAVGAWNWSEISPAQMLGRFNGWAKAVIVRVSEARDLGDVDRFSFYDHSTVYIAAPPDVIRVDEKNLREHSVFNVCGVIITTNHSTDGIYLPADDRRHMVAWSEASKEDFPANYWRELWGWYADGGQQQVAKYLLGLDLADFDPKAPPPKTAAFWTIVQAGSAPEDSELRDVLDRAGNPAAVTLQSLINNASACGLNDLVSELSDRKNRRSLPHKLERIGYVPVRNPDAEDGLWKIGGRRQVAYANRRLALLQQVRAARELAR